ncbi:MAG: hypothetical protein CH6_2167 [Candidatus Kapaibacterium sp.]|nr:MAG: hypothetical protein CH6_2167 [Candidatus Kapabacteria bacterium]
MFENLLIYIQIIYSTFLNTILIITSVFSFFFVKLFFVNISLVKKWE